MTHRAGLPAERVNLEPLVLRAGPAILDEPRCVSWLRLDLCRHLAFLGRVSFGNRFRSSFEVFLAEFELRHPRARYRIGFLGFEDYGRAVTDLVTRMV